MGYTEDAESHGYSLGEPSRRWDGPSIPQKGAKGNSHKEHKEHKEHKGKTMGAGLFFFVVLVFFVANLQLSFLA